MWHIYSSIAVLFGGAYCIPLRNTADQLRCTVGIKHFDESVKTLEVEWNSTVHLICDASCVGPGPQLHLTWFYRIKNQSKLINIQKLFRSTKFETYPTNYHWKNELIIRDFGPNEETTFICRGSIKEHKLKAEVELIGTDCLLKYKFRCQMDKRCIDRGYLCNHNNECPDGEDEVGCDITTKVSTMWMTETDVETKQTSEERTPCEFGCRDGTCIASTKKCDGIPDCPDGDDETCGAYSSPLITTTDKSPCTLVIKHSGEPVTTLEVAWYSTIHLICDASCVGSGLQPTLAWFYRVKNQSKLINIEKLSGSPKFETYIIDSYWKKGLRIRDFGPNEETKFICKESKTEKKLEAGVELIGTEESKPDITIIVLETSVVALIGSTARLECYVYEETGHVSLFWSRTGGLPAGSVQTDGILTIPDIQPSYAGNYLCTGTTDTGRRGSAVTRLSVEMKPVRPNPIRVQLDRTRIEVEEGQTARIVCTAVGSLREATYILSWSKQGAAMPSRAIDKNGVLIIPNIQVSDAGNFVCTGSDMFSTGSVTATIIVTTSESAPSIRIEPRYQTVEEGSPVQFECIVTATPRAKVEWHRGDRPLSPEASVTQDGVFQLPRAQSSDEGDYFCKATNNVGTSDMRTILYVTKKETKPDITIIVRQTSVVALIGSTARLECYVEETGRVILFWSRTGGLPPGSVQTDGILTIPDIQPSYAGKYLCTGTTDTGRRGSAVTRLSVEMKPVTERPTVRVEPEKITVPLGTTGTLHCIVTGVPAPTITWLKSRQELYANHQIDGDILRITQATMEDRGIYVCRAENIAGSDQDWGIVEVERRLRPKIDLYPESNQTVSVGVSTLFQCRVINGDPPPKVTWSRVGGLQLTERTYVMANGVIMFKGTTQQEQGSYICTATTDMGTTTTTATLIVRGPPTIVIQPSKIMYAIVGQRVRMECVAQGDPTPSVYWIDSLVPRRDIVPGASFPLEEGTAILDITNVGKENTGYYTCIAENVGGRTEDRVLLIVEESQRAEVKIAGPETLSVVDGESVELACTATAILNPLIRWQRRGGRMPPGHSLRGGILSIPRLTVEYGGEYICSTSSPEGSYQASVFIVVTVSPRLTVSPSRLVARAGEDIILRCSPTGSGPFNIEWSKVNGSLSPRASKNEGILEIQQVTAADAGRYRCVARSASGCSEGYAIVEITVPPTVRALKREYNVQQNAVLELRCDFTGSPEPTVRWDHESGELPPHHRIQDSVLIIYNVQPADSGKYICMATNAAGTARDYVFVTVALSGPVINGRETRIDTQTLNVGDRVEMECIVAGTPLPTIRWNRDDGPLPANAILGDGILIIPDARLEDAGMYTCTAINQAGSAQSKVVLYVRARPLISVPQISMTAALGDSASIGCEATGYPSPQITWYRKDGQMPSEYTIVDGNLKIPRVKTEDAGTYICSAQNQYGQSNASVDLKIGDTTVSTTTTLSTTKITCPPTTAGFIYDNPEEKDNSVKAVHDGYYDYDNE